jgi:hypothetical protein
MTGRWGKGIALGLLLSCVFFHEVEAQNGIPPLPDRQMEVTPFGYRINGRFNRLWYPSQPKFREEFTINPKVQEQYEQYLRVAYPAKGVRVATVGLMGSLFFVQYSHWGAIGVIGGSVVGNLLAQPLYEAKRRRLRRAVELRNEAWYIKVRE